LANGRSRLDDGVPTLDVLGLLQNEQLRQIAEREPAAESVLLLRVLHQKRDTAGLTDDEEVLARDLVQSYDRAVLIRSRALLLLHQRGEDISALVGGA
jgi:predicted solute-binding protein